MAIKIANRDSSFNDGSRNNSSCCMLQRTFSHIDMVHSMAEATNLTIGKTTMNVSIHEDNLGALVLAQILPPQFTPRSKYDAIKTIWFREEIFKSGIQLIKIDTINQLGESSLKVSQKLFSNTSEKKSWDGIVIPHSLTIFRSLNSRFQSRGGVLY